MEKKQLTKEELWQLAEETTVSSFFSGNTPQKMETTELWKFAEEHEINTPEQLEKLSLFLLDSFFDKFDIVPQKREKEQRQHFIQWLSFEFIPRPVFGALIIVLFLVNLLIIPKYFLKTTNTHPNLNPTMAQALERNKCGYNSSSNNKTSLDKSKKHINQEKETFSTNDFELTLWATNCREEQVRTTFANTDDVCIHAKSSSSFSFNGMNVGGIIWPSQHKKEQMERLLNDCLQSDSQEEKYKVCKLKISDLGKKDIIQKIWFTILAKKYTSNEPNKPTKPSVVAMKSGNDSKTATIEGIVRLTVKQ